MQTCNNATIYSRHTNTHLLVHTQTTYPRYQMLTHTLNNRHWPPATYSLCSYTHIRTQHVAKLHTEWYTMSAHTHTHTYTPPRQWWIDTWVLGDRLHMHCAVRIYTEKLINNDNSIGGSPLPAHSSTCCNLPCMITPGSWGRLAPPS